MKKPITLKSYESNIYNDGIESCTEDEYYDKALTYFEKAAKEGYSEAFCEIGIILYRERNDVEEAEKWFRQAEEMGALSPEGYFAYGMLHFQGKEDWQTGLKYLHQAASQGYERAYGDIACIYYHYQSNFETALEWFVRAYEAGCLYPNHSYSYGLLLAGEMNEPAKSIIFFRHAAYSKLEWAYGYLGAMLYFNNEIDEAEIWFEKAVKADCLRTPNTHIYGLLLKENRGDIEKGNYYLEKAAKELREYS